MWGAPAHQPRMSTFSEGEVNFVVLSHQDLGGGGTCYCIITKLVLTDNSSSAGLKWTPNLPLIFCTDVITLPLNTCMTHSAALKPGRLN